MGLFTKRVELKKEYFLSGLDLDKTNLCNFRERQGFKIKLSSSYNSTTVTAELGGYFRYFHIYNEYFSNGEKECRFFFVGFDLKEISDFLRQNFKIVSKDFRYIASDGSPAMIGLIPQPAVFLENGDIICQGHFENNLYSFKIITPDKFYNK